MLSDGNRLAVINLLSCIDRIGPRNGRVLTPDEKAYNRDPAYGFLMADPASPGDDDTRDDGVSESADDGGNIDAGSGDAEETDTTETGSQEDTTETGATGDGEGGGGASRDPTGLEDITGIGPTKADALREAGFASVEDVRTATTAELSEASGIGEKLANRIGDEGGEVEPARDGNGGEVEPARDGDGGEIEPARDDGGGLLGYGKAGGPEADEEMPLTAHIEEMIKRLVIVAVVAGIVSLLVFPFADRIVNFLWNSILPTGAGSDFARPRLYSVLEFWFTKVKVASLAGVIVGLPVLVYQTYRFMRPGLYPNERRYYLAAVPTSLVLALVGVAFAYFIVLPSVFTYFLYYSEGVTTIGFALGRTFNLILIMMAYLAIVFQIPLFILLAMLMGLVTRRWLANRRLIFWGAFLGISFVFSPDPTGMVPILITLTMIALFEGTLLLTRWTQGRGGGGESGIGI